MADVSGKLFEQTAEEFSIIFRSSTDAWQQAPSTLGCRIKEFHDSFHSLHGRASSDYIPELIIDGMVEEQIWQQQEVQMDAVKKFLHENLTSSKLEQSPFQFLMKVAGNQVQEQTASQTALDPTENEPVPSESETEASEDEDSDPELSEIKKRIKKQDGFFDFDGSGDELFNGAEDEWGEEEEEEKEEDQNDFDFDLPSKRKEGQKTGKSKKRKTEVDDRFFKLAEMEEFLDQEDKKEERKIARGDDSDASEEDESDDEDSGKKLDMFSTWSDEETGKESMYADFFDPPEDGGEDEQALASESEEEETGEENDDEEDEEDMDTDDDDRPKSSKKVRFSDTTKLEGEEKEKLSLSNFEKRTEKLQRQIQDLEEQSLAEKPWQMMGEVGAKERPENSLLQEHVDFKQAPPSAAEMTQERSQSVDQVILQRIIDKAFDDNVRQVRPVEEAFELHTQKTLDQEKSKFSLQELYEQEFLKLQAPEDEEKTNPLHDEIKGMLNDLFPRLDALASCHYTPLPAVREIRVKNNLSSIAMEEATPITMSKSAVLAPEEIKERKKGEVKGQTERTKEDKQRERKQKKAAKRRKAQEREKRQKEVERLNPGQGNKYAKERALKQLQKEASGTIEVVKDKKSKKTMSSKLFFTHLQDEVTAQSAARTKKKNEKTQVVGEFFAVVV